MKKLFILLALLIMAAPASAAPNELFLFIWSEYLPDQVVEQFTRETGIKVNISTYDSNEAMYAKVKMVGGKGYDLIVPSSDYVARMMREDMLVPLDHSLLPNLCNLDQDLVTKMVDPESTYSVPYMWGSTAIAVNTNDIDPATVTSINDLWRPEFADKLVLPNDMRGVLGLGLKSLGYSLNDTDPQHLHQAFEKLKTLIPHVRVFDSDSPKQALLNGEVQLGAVWNGEAYIANSEDPAIVYVYPREGYSLWVDSFAIPRGAANIPQAHAFINFLLRPDMAKIICEELGYSSPNVEAVKSLSREVRNNPIVYPSREDLSRGEFETDLGEATRLYNELWMRLKK
ncbi:extracellular solute-binding protein [Desulfoplanes formicivorans]|uniref:Spermidine/putrescine ABC transporter substrate-binding protein n=1 Tax=Desulfoplanes formicivorans TaxID=1592317 RepID=A0A194AMN3_9BACT|nr:extracellular solute-binding protein [Desulfoplanes formicivorans]GAU09884.1 spermidine/putrescine ABC transporter substrate-binding protein [Desulfoplanes formicivorans]